MAKFKKARTLLDNLQQGREEVKKSSFSFDGINKIKVFERKEIVMPYLSQLDQREIRGNLMSYRFNQIAAQNSAEYNKLIPQHLSNDIYSLYHNESENVRLASLTSSNKLKHKIISKVNKSNLKILTNGSHLKTMILTKELCNYIFEIFRNLPPEEQEKIKDQLQNSSNEEGDGSGDGEGAGNQQGSNSPGSGQQPSGAGKDDLDKLLDSSNSNQMLDQAIKNAEDTIKKIDNSGINVDEEDPEQVTEIVGKLDQLDGVKRELEEIAVNRATLGKAVEKILDNSLNFFTRKTHEHTVPLIEADEILDIEGIEFLHPIFKNTGIMDMGVIEKTYSGRFDLYVDNSGSMGGTCMKDAKGRAISSMTLAKALALNMKRMNLLKDLYEFQDRVTKLGNSELSIFDMSARGGTNLNNVLINVAKTGRNSIILTDGEDYIHYHHPKVLFLGIAGVRFNSFRPGYGYQTSNPPQDSWERISEKAQLYKSINAGSMFLKRKQCCIFDGRNLTYPTI